MREFTVVFEEGLRRGLKPNSGVPRRTQWLQEALGLIPEDDVLQTIPQLPPAIATLNCAYPYPQVFKVNHLILVCDARAIYTYDDGTLTLRYICSTSGCTWSVADFSDFIVLCNGVCIVTRDPRDGTFSEYSDCGVPVCIALCNLNGQLIVAGPGVTVGEGFDGG